MGRKKRYHRCSCCNSKAVYLYMPGRNGKVFFCERCVPRGCSCNLFNLNEFPESNNGITSTMYWNDRAVNEYINGKLNNNEFEKLGTLEKKNDSVYYEILDDCGRREPCCEYDFSIHGFEIEIPDIMIKKHDLLNCISKVRNCYYLNTNNINWNKLIIYLRDEFGEELNYHTIFSDIENNMIDNFIILNITDLRIPIIVKKKNIVKKFIREIRKLAKAYKYKKYNIDK